MWKLIFIFAFCSVAVKSQNVSKCGPERDCNEGFWDKQACECNCPDYIQDPCHDQPGTIYDNTICKCVGVSNCERKLNCNGAEWDDKACKCICPVFIQDPCLDKPGTTYSNKICRCVRNGERCFDVVDQ